MWIRNIFLFVTILSCAPYAVHAYTTGKSHSKRAKIIQSTSQAGMSSSTANRPVPSVPPVRIYWENWSAPPYTIIISISSGGSEFASKSLDEAIVEAMSKAVKYGASALVNFKCGSYQGRVGLFYSCTGDAVKLR